MKLKRLLLMAILLCPVVSVMADSITLKDGKVLTGEIINNGSKGVLIEYFVTPTIKDQKLVSKDDIEKISTTPLDESAFQALGGLSTPQTVLETSFYDLVVDKKIPEFLNRFPYSRHILELREKLASLEAERTRIRNGDRRIDGVWIEAAKIEADPYQSGAKIKYAEMKEQMRADDPVSALQSYELIEKKYPGSEVMPDAVDSALTEMDLLQVRINAAKANFDVVDKRLQKALEHAPADQAKEMKDSLEKDGALAKKAMAAATADGSKFFPVFQNNKDALDALQTLVATEKARLLQLQKTTMREGIAAAKKAILLVKEENSKDALVQLTLSQKLWPANVENAGLVAEVDRLAKTQASAAEAAKKGQQSASKAPSKP